MRANDDTLIENLIDDIANINMVCGRTDICKASYQDLRSLHNFLQSAAFAVARLIGKKG